MLEFLDRISNFYWAGDVFLPSFKPQNAAECLAGAQGLQGQFSFALDTPQKRIFLVRDRLGINKLFFALHRSGKVIAANYLMDLVQRGVPFEAIYSVPAGHFVEIDMQERKLALQRYFQLKSESQDGGPSLQTVAERIRAQIELWFSRIAKQFGSRHICLCLSGGLDSGVIAAVAKRYFANVTAYTYGFCEADQLRGEDVYYAQQIAEFLGISMRIVPASSEDILGALEAALCYGQDWRDFNVHCAVVNEILARAIQADVPEWKQKQDPLLLTGDLMNEFLVDYTPISYAGREYYALPKMDVGELRLILIRGLDTGDREIGVFNRHRLEIIQPYGFLLDHYLALPPSFLGEPGSKQKLARAIAGDLLPSFIFEREKVRAQIGSSQQPVGILPLLVESGRDAQWMRRAFCRLFGVREEGFLNRFIRTGLYRFIHEFPKDERRINGYYLR